LKTTTPARRSALHSNTDTCTADQEPRCHHGGGGCCALLCDGGGNIAAPKAGYALKSKTEKLFCCAR
jgi:hypothetical protein